MASWVSGLGSSPADLRALPSHAPSALSAGPSDRPASGSLSASIWPSNNLGDVPLNETFSSSVSGGTPPYTLSWTFGDGGTAANLTAPQHTYTAAGNYTTTLSVVDHVGATASATTSVEVNRTLGVSASATPTSGTSPLSVAFSGSAWGGVPPYLWSWTFGDGATSTSQNSTHTYTSGGSFQATLTVRDQAGLSLSSTPVTIAVTPGPLVATASVSSAQGSTPFNVSFTGSATGGTAPYAYAWAFGDGGTSILQDPSHTFTAEGTYAAQLNVTDANGKTSQATVTVHVTSALRAYASGHPTSGTSPMTGYLFGNATGGVPPYNFDWIGPDGGGIEGPQRNVSVPFYSAGTYVWTLNVSDAAGNYNVSNSVVFTVAPGPLTVHDYLAFTTSWSLTDSADVTVIGGEAPYNVSWAWGDGAMSYVSYPSNDFASHTYAKPGSYSVNMTVRDALGATASNVTLVTIEGQNATGGALAVQIAASATSGSSPLTVDFTGSSSGVGPYVWSWTFGDGQSSNLQDPSHTYQVGGLYDASLAVRNSTGAYGQTSVWINVSGAPPGGGTGPAALVAKASATPLSGSVPLNVSFTGSATGGSPPYVYRWEFGDGQGSTLQDPQHTYLGGGSFLAALQVVDNEGHSSATFVEVNVSSVGCGNCSPVPTLTSPTTVVAGETASFSASFTGVTTGTYDLLWSFGDGTTAASTIDLQVTSQTTVQHTFLVAGTFHLSLLVSGATGQQPSGGVATLLVKPATPSVGHSQASSLPAWLVPAGIIGGLAVVILVTATQVQRKRKVVERSGPAETPSESGVLPPYRQYQEEYETPPGPGEGADRERSDRKGNGTGEDGVVGLL